MQALTSHHQRYQDYDDNVVTEEIEEEFESQYEDDSDSEEDNRSINENIQENINLQDSYEEKCPPRSPSTPQSTGSTSSNTSPSSSQKNGKQLELEPGKKKPFVTQGPRFPKGYETSTTRVKSARQPQISTLTPGAPETQIRPYRGSPAPSPHHKHQPIMINTNRIASRSPSPSMKTISPTTPPYPSMKTISPTTPPYGGIVTRGGMGFSQSPTVKLHHQNSMMSITMIQSPSHKVQPNSGTMHYVKLQSSTASPKNGSVFTPPESPRTPRTPVNNLNQILENQSPTSHHFNGSPRSQTSRTGSGGSSSSTISEDETRSFQQLTRRQRRRTLGIKNYRKGDLIGQGANGRVYLSYNMDYGNLFVIKEITFANVPPSVLEEKLVALQREINVMKSLEHENIVQYYGAEKVGTTLNIFLEYIAGGSVASLVKRYGRLSEEVIRQYTKQILTGLQYLHQNMIVHRDIKGANILVNVEGVLKLADFGASRQIQDIMTLSTEFKSLMGTPHFMAPEVIMQTGHGRSADIWSVACTVLEMFTGKPPFSEYTTAAAVMFHIASTNEPPFYSDNISETARDFLDKCFLRDPSKRWTAEKLLEHIWLKDVELPYLSEQQPQRSPSTPPTPSKYSQVVPSNYETVPRISTPDNLASRLKHNTGNIRLPLENEDEKEEYMIDDHADDNLLKIDEEDLPILNKVTNGYRNFEKKNYEPVQPREGYDDAGMINKFLKKRSVWQSRSFKQSDLKGMISDYNRKQQSVNERSRSRSNSNSSNCSSSNPMTQEGDDSEDFPIRDGMESPRDIDSPRARKSPLSSPRNKNNSAQNVNGFYSHTEYSNTKGKQAAPPLDLRSQLTEDTIPLSSSVKTNQQNHLTILPPLLSSPLDKPINTAYTDLFRKKHDEKKRIEMLKKSEFEEEQRRYLQQNMKEIIESKVEEDLHGDDNNKTRAHTAPMKRNGTAENNSMPSTFHSNKDKEVDDLPPSRGKKISGTRITQEIVTQQPQASSMSSLANVPRSPPLVKNSRNIALRNGNATPVPRK